MANDDIDMMNDDDSGDELEGAGMHLIGDEDGDDEEGDAEAPAAPASPVLPEEEEAPKDGLAELEELEQSLDAERNGYDEEEDDDEGV